MKPPKLKVVCSRCKEPVDIHFNGDVATDPWDKIEVTVDTCLKCLRREYGIGYSRGYAEGRDSIIKDRIEGAYS
jgi:hypothetical protein